MTPAVALLAVVLPLQPWPLALGLGVFALMPTTLSTGIAMTQVGSNAAWPLDDGRAPPRYHSNLCMCFWVGSSAA